MSRNHSVMQVQSNPYEADEDPIVTVKVENLSDAVLIDEAALKSLLTKLTNEE